jgi:hypothetical protein
MSEETTTVNSTAESNGNGDISDDKKLISSEVPSEEKKSAENARPVSTVRVSTALASRTAGLDTGKIGMPGMMGGMPPPRFKKKDVNENSDRPDNDSPTRNVSVAESIGSETRNPLVPRTPSPQRAASPFRGGSPPRDISNDGANGSAAPGANKRVSTALASRMAGLDTSKIMMPGAAPPARFSVKPGGLSPMMTVSEDEESHDLSISKEEVSDPRMSRAIMKGPAKRRPTKKTAVTGGGSDVNMAKSLLLSTDTSESLTSESEIKVITIEPIIAASKEEKKTDASEGGKNDSSPSKEEKKEETKETKPDEKIQNKDNDTKNEKEVTKNNDDTPVVDSGLSSCFRKMCIIL